ncbi:hypothetical protein RF11_12638 [Thelohanellus kitauei]|uniref:Uncharacterized protein n=1 Tax=Thelohanellus kitauei TaxID=669202 RepID=A0A0C2NLI1_THEKT|nr:hypothetical protein RF11_12638 [Thelohanellus kitauei]
MNYSPRTLNATTRSSPYDTGRLADYQELFGEGQARGAEMIEFLQALPAEEKMNENGKIELSDFLKADGCLSAGGYFTFEEIEEEISRSEDPVGGNRFVRGSPTHIEQRAEVRAIEKLELDNEMYVIHQKKMRQPTIP